MGLGNLLRGKRGKKDKRGDLLSNQQGYAQTPAPTVVSTSGHPTGMQYVQPVTMQGPYPTGVPYVQPTAMQASSSPPYVGQPMMYQAPPESNGQPLRQDPSQQQGQLLTSPGTPSQLQDV